MEPEDQSRNSRPKPDPVTIDLGAEEVKEVPSADSDGTEDNVTAEATSEPVAEAATDAKADQAEPPRSYSGIPNSSTSATATAPANPQRSPGSLGLIAASLLGGVIALGGAAGLQYWGVLPSLGTNEKAEASLNLMASDVNALKARLEEVAAATPKIDLSPVETKITAIEEKLTRVPEANGLSADADARITALSEQVRAAEAAGATLKTDSETPSFPMVY